MFLEEKKSPILETSAFKAEVGNYNDMFLKSE